MERWIEEDRKALRTPNDLARYVRLSRRDRPALERVCGRFRMKITRHYAGLIDWRDPEDPLALMVVPRLRELRIRKDELHDPIGDKNDILDNRPAGAVTHRYPDRVLLHLASRCGGHCRFCFRKRLVGRRELRPAEKDLAEALAYIRSRKEVHEVILTGGDPLTASDRELFEVLESIKAIPHVWTIRIHTRMPAWNPYRITDELVSGLRRFRPLSVVTHFNHSRELGPVAGREAEAAGREAEVAGIALARLVDAGLMVLNQTVLLKGVNDSAEMQRELSWALVRRGIKPYYLHQLDRAKGISHFQVERDRGVEIVRELWGALPGYAVPRFVLDIPGGHGKIPLQHQYLGAGEEGETVVETPRGDFLRYNDDDPSTPEKGFPCRPPYPNPST